ncbi:MAG: LPP20 family lipoprotein [Ectothiorhodospiraceae bacterium]|jgi:hypothetical protein|nr:LPP20 family lipoprotein [Ectothiorhodospiraceae bacterium]
MKMRTILAPLLLTGLAGCTNTPFMLADSGTQSVSVATRTSEGVAIHGAQCTLSNDAGQWELRAPGSVTVNRSTSNLTVTCAKGELGGFNVVVPGQQTLACEGGEICGYPSIIQVDMTGPHRKIRVSGHGSVPENREYSEGQRRLLAMRASRLDAYRALTEQIYGVRVSGNSTVRDMAIHSDLFRTYLDAFVRGARVLSVTAYPDGVYETELEVTLGNEFYAALGGGSGDCGMVGGVGPGCAYAGGGTGGLYITP